MKTLMKFVVSVIFLLMMGVLSSYVIKENKKTLSDKEVKSLLFMLEEEKMALDVYTLMDEKWGTKQFNNIKDSEAMHMEAVKNILDNHQIKYSLLEAGKFQDQNLQKLYNSLIAQGNQSELEALKAGAKIEDVDIYDLERLKRETKNENIINTYNFLECGSRNHLRAFSRGLKMNNASYNPEFISKKDYEKILNNEQEKCGQQFGKGMGNEKGKNCDAKKSGSSCGEKGNYGRKVETGEESCCGGCE